MGESTTADAIPEPVRERLAVIADEGRAEGVTSNRRVAVLRPNGVLVTDNICTLRFFRWVAACRCP